MKPPFRPECIDHENGLWILVDADGTRLPTVYRSLLDAERAACHVEVLTE